MTDSSTPAGFVRQGWRWSGRLLTGVISLALTLLGLLAFTFTLSHLAPIDPTLQVAGDHASEATYAQVRRDLGLDQSVPVQFTRYLERLAHGDMGISRITAQPVASDLMRTFRQRSNWRPVQSCLAAHSAFCWRCWRCGNREAGWITLREWCRCSVILYRFSG